MKILIACVDNEGCHIYLSILMVSSLAYLVPSGLSCFEGGIWNVLEYLKNGTIKETTDDSIHVT